MHSGGHDEELCRTRTAEVATLAVLRFQAGLYTLAN
jgi:hypothetical protein